MRIGPSSGIRCQNVITITAAGRRQLHKLDRLIDRAQERLLALLSATERAELVDLLARISRSAAPE